MSRSPSARGSRRGLGTFLFLLFLLFLLDVEEEGRDTKPSAMSRRMAASIRSTCLLHLASFFSFLLASSAEAVRNRREEESTASPDAPASTGRPRSGELPRRSAAGCGHSSAARAPRGCPAAPGRRSLQFLKRASFTSWTGVRLRTVVCYSCQSHGDAKLPAQRGTSNRRSLLRLVEVPQSRPAIMTQPPEFRTKTGSPHKGRLSSTR